MGVIFQEEVKNLQCDNKIFKISKIVFSYDIVKYDQDYILTICELIDLGPNLYRVFFATILITSKTF